MEKPKTGATSAAAPGQEFRHGTLPPPKRCFTSLAILGIQWSGRVCPSGSKPCETFGFGRTLQANLWHARNAFAALTPAEGTGHSHFTILPFSIAIFLPGVYTCLLIPIRFFRSFFVLMKKIRVFFSIYRLFIQRSSTAFCSPKTCFHALLYRKPLVV